MARHRRNVAGSNLHVSEHIVSTQSFIFSYLNRVSLLWNMIKNEYIRGGG